MLRCAKEFIDLLTSKDLNFDVKETTDKEGDEKIIVSFPYHQKTTKIVFTGDIGEYVMFYVVFESVPDDKYADVLLTCNELNMKYKWCTFYIDDDKDIMDTYNAILTPGNAGEVAFEILVRMNQILDDAKAPFMRALYSL